MAQTPQRRSAAQPPDPSLPPQPQLGHLAQARMAVSRAMADASVDKINYQKKGFLSLPGMYEALAEPLAENLLSLSTALVFSVEANVFVVRTTLTSMQTGESDYSDFPIASIDKKDDIGGLLTFGTRYNAMALLAFFPDRDGDAPAGQSATGGSFAGAPSAAPARTGYGRPAQPDPAPAQAPPAPVFDSGTGQWVIPGQQQPVMAAPDLGPPPLPQFQAPAQTGVQRTDPIAYPVYDPSVAPQVLSS